MIAKMTGKGVNVWNWGLSVVVRDLLMLVQTASLKIIVREVLASKGWLTIFGLWDLQFPYTTQQDLRELIKESFENVNSKVDQDSRIQGDLNAHHSRWSNWLSSISGIFSLGLLQIMMHILFWYNSLTPYVPRTIETAGKYASSTFW